MPNSRFDPIPDAAYGSCLTCDATFQSQDDATAHSLQTLTEARAANPAANTVRSHSYRPSNPTREERIAASVRSTVTAAIEDALTDIINEIDSDDLTPDEARAALTFFSDFHEAWDETDWENR